MIIHGRYASSFLTMRRKTLAYISVCLHINKCGRIKMNTGYDRRFYRITHRVVTKYYAERAAITQFEFYWPVCMQMNVPEREVAG